MRVRGIERERERESQAVGEEEMGYRYSETARVIDSKS